MTKQEIQAIHAEAKSIVGNCKAELAETHSDFAAANMEHAQTIISLLHYNKKNSASAANGLKGGRPHHLRGGRPKGSKNKPKTSL